MREVTRCLLGAATNEQDVAAAYRAEIVHWTGATITSPVHGDGCASWTAAGRDLCLWMEFKDDRDLKDRREFCAVLAQVVHYLRKVADSGTALPHAILVADRNEYALVGLNVLRNFLDWPGVRWDLAPSTGDPVLRQALVDGINTLPWVHDVGTHSDFRALLDDVDALARGVDSCIEPTTKNLQALYEDWTGQVLRDTNLSPHEVVDVFYRWLLYPSDVVWRPEAPRELILRDYADPVRVDPDGLKRFLSRYRQGVNPAHREEFWPLKDVLLQDETRRRQGAYYTPRAWAQEAHRVLDGVLGSNWRQDCVVWDPAAGTCNLERDFLFERLFLSTLEAPDVTTMLRRGEHPGARIFRWDFLNPDDPERGYLPKKVEAELRALAKEGRRLVFLMNSPYAEDGVVGATGETRAKVADTAVAEDLRELRMGRASRQLYAQFMLRCAELARETDFKSYTVALFSKPTFMTSRSFGKFRAWWYGRHVFRGGFIFRSSHFKGLSNRWGVSFTVWDSSGMTPPDAELELAVLDMKGGKVVEMGRKALYNSDGREAGSWVSVPHANLSDTPKFSSGLKVHETTYKGGQNPRSLGVLCNMSNNVYDSAQGVNLRPGKPPRTGQGHTDILPANFRRVVALFAARKLVTGTWLNDKDEYLVPSESAPEYARWVDDCHVWMLLHPSNNCTAMRDVPYKGRNWKIDNNLFWIPRGEALAAFDRSRCHGLYTDAKVAEKAGYEPYLAGQLPGLRLSEVASEVLDKLGKLWLHSLGYREQFAAEHPELHLLAWDAGVYQLKHLFREKFPLEWEELRAAWRHLGDRLRPGVYDYGFLRR